MPKLRRFPTEQTRPTIKHAARQHASSGGACWAPAAASPRSKHRQHRPPRRGPSRAVALHQRTPSGGQFGLPPPTPGAELLPEAGRGVYADGAAGRRAGFPLLSVRHDAALFLRHQRRRERAAAPRTPERAAETVMLSKTGGKIPLPLRMQARDNSSYAFIKNNTDNLQYIFTLRIYSKRLIVRWAYLQLLNIHKREKGVLQICLESGTIPTGIKMTRTWGTCAYKRAWIAHCNINRVP